MFLVRIVVGPPIKLGLRLIASMSKNAAFLGVIFRFLVVCFNLYCFWFFGGENGLFWRAHCYDLIIPFVEMKNFTKI